MLPQIYSHLVKKFRNSNPNRNFILEFNVLGVQFLAKVVTTCRPLRWVFFIRAKIIIEKYLEIRNTYAYIYIMEKQKRFPRSYKARKTPYVKASRRAKFEKRTLAEVVEWCVGMYAEGSPSVFFGAMPSPKPKKQKS